MKWLRTRVVVEGLRILCAGLLVAAPAAFACNVPVFRYALERWPSENYELVLFHRGALSRADQLELTTLTNSLQQLHANAVLRLVDLGASHGMDEQKLWRAQTNAMLPWTVLCAPHGDEAQQVLWAGELRDASNAKLFDSPARRELTRRLAEGDAVVWVMIDGGDRAQDEAVATLLTNELKRLQSVLKLPPPAPDDPAPRASIPLRIQFSIQRLVRGEAAERIFLQMLLHGEEVQPGKPAVVPVFGRARALTALSGFDLSAKVFSQAAAFLCGACSCEVKDLNPGKDLLVAMNWESIFAGAAPIDAGGGSGITAGERVPIGPGNPAAVSAADSRVTTDAPNPRRGMKLLASATLAFVCILVLLIGIAMLRSLRQR